MMGHFLKRYTTARWWIVALLFAVTVINYVDRQTLSILSATLRTELHLTDTDYANAVSAFLFTYLVMYTISGRLIDRFGVRICTTACVAWWSIAAMLTGLARGATSLAMFRSLLGIGEPGIFPAGVKACGEWFPQNRRALATGIFSSGSAVGAVIAAPLVVWMTVHFGWQASFFISGVLGLAWIPLWLLMYRHPARHPAVTAQDLAELEAGAISAPRPTWRQLLSQRSIWALVLARFASDPVWYFYLFWLPDYFQRIRHLSLVEIGIYGWIPFLFADVGNVCGGIVSDFLIRRGWSAVRGRFAVLVGVAVLAPLGACVGLMTSTVAAVAFTCLATFLCQAWSTNMATLSADITDRTATATVLGLMGTAGSLGGLAFAQALGLLIGALGYSAAFATAALLHPLAALLLFLLLRPVLGRTEAARSVSGRRH